MGDKGKRDKGKREEQKKGKHTLKDTEYTLLAYTTTKFRHLQVCLGTRIDSFK